MIRQSYADEACIKSRDLFDLGSDPTRFIIYPGGNSYYYDPGITDALEEKGVAVDQDGLDDIFFPFLRVDIQRVISGFDRSRRQSGGPQKPAVLSRVHDFDKRRYHYLRFGPSSQRHMAKVPQTVFGPLMEKSRDELEQYFQAEERNIKHRERPYYLATIFQLDHVASTTGSNRSFIQQMDDFFLSRLCTLNQDQTYLAGTEAFGGLFPYLVKYAVGYFDGSLPGTDDETIRIMEFIRRHRTYRPPPKVQHSIKETEALFGSTWKELKQMKRSQLSRRYRKAAIKHHPDQGGDPEVFRRLTEVYRALLEKYGR
jgi:hypothetical protein